MLIEGEEATENNPAERVGMLQATEDAMAENRSKRACTTRSVKTNKGTNEKKHQIVQFSAAICKGVDGDAACKGSG